VVNGGPSYIEWTVYDSNLGVCWLADGNLAGDPAVVVMMKPFMTPKNADGSRTGHQSRWNHGLRDGFELGRRAEPL